MKERLKGAVVEGLVLAAVLCAGFGITGFKRPEGYSYWGWMFPNVLSGVGLFVLAYLLGLWFERQKCVREGKKVGLTK